MALPRLKKLCEDLNCNREGKRFMLEYLPHSRELMHKKLQRHLPDRWARWLADRWPYRWLPTITVDDYEIYHYFYCDEHAQRIRRWN